ncbi:hypothetical protein Fmac_015208 [Flemingia macrophylla]|uniref:Uncharacterized protein n=1 Tax=Flemingia macrophylla TaxID=520843 RepID=A0ABD1MFZ3_9FABA
MDTTSDRIGVNDKYVEEGLRNQNPQIRKQEVRDLKPKETNHFVAPRADSPHSPCGFQSSGFLERSFTCSHWSFALCSVVFTEAVRSSSVGIVFAKDVCGCFGRKDCFKCREE